MRKGLGRLPVVDGRDRAYSVRSLIQTPMQTSDVESIEALNRGWRYWFHRGWSGDQGNSSKCVAYASLHVLEDGPHTLEDRSIGADPIMDPDKLYRLSQENDEFVGENYEGTTARGAAKALQKEGLIREYRWAFTAMEVIETILRHGPVLLGCIWMSGMDEPDADGFIHPTGWMRGGHEVELNGANVNSMKVRGKNSWGLSWGDNGHFWLSFENLAFLLERAGGDACVLVQ